MPRTIDHKDEFYDLSNLKSIHKTATKQSLSKK